MSMSLPTNQNLLLRGHVERGAGIRLLSEDIRMVLGHQGRGDLALVRRFEPVANVLDIYRDFLVEQLLCVHHPKVEPVLPVGDLDTGESRDDADHVRLGERPGDEPFQVHRLVLPGEHTDEIRLGAHIAGDDRHEIRIGILVGDILQRHPDELGVADDDVGPFGDHLLGVWDCRVRGHFLPVDVFQAGVLGNEPLGQRDRARLTRLCP